MLINTLSYIHTVLNLLLIQYYEAVFQTIWNILQDQYTQTWHV